MVILLGSLQLGLLYGLLAIGIYISFRILNIPDLTAEGSFTFGLAVSAVMTVAGHPYLGILLGTFAGALAGIVTALLQTKMGINPILSGILTMSGLYSVNLCVMGESSNVTLIGKSTMFTDGAKLLAGVNNDIVKLILIGAVIVICTLVMILFFKTSLGLAIRATGDNQSMVRASSINVDATKTVAIAVSNALIALNGAVIAQYQNFADINSGVGILVVGLASVIIGEVIVGRRSVTVGFISAVIGSLIYRFIIAVATKYSILPAYALKLVSSIIVAIALVLPLLKTRIGEYKSRKRGIKNA